MQNLECKIACGACCKLWYNIKEITESYPDKLITDPCPYLGDEGCLMSRNDRPAECVYYLCANGAVDRILKTAQPTKDGSEVAVKLRYALAENEHRKWSQWTQQMLATMTPVKVAHWRKWINSDFNTLTAAETVSDFAHADKIIGLMKLFEIEVVNLASIIKTLSNLDPTSLGAVELAINEVRKKKKKDEELVALKQKMNRFVDVPENPTHLELYTEYGCVFCDRLTKGKTSGWPICLECYNTRDSAQLIELINAKKDVDKDAEWYDSSSVMDKITECQADCKMVPPRSEVPVFTDGDGNELDATPEIDVKLGQVTLNPDVKLEPKYVDDLAVKSRPDGGEPVDIPENPTHLEYRTEYPCILCGIPEKGRVAGWPICLECYESSDSETICKKIALLEKEAE